jgi:RND family efflux transporter MFP subunit
VRTAVATSSASQRYQVVTGTVIAADRAKIASKIMGTITRLPVVLGQVVKAGDLLVEIRADEIAARLDQARAALAQAEGDLERETRLLAQSASPADTVRNLEDRRRQMTAAVAEAESLLAYTRILAPFDGTVARRPANEGDLAAPGSTLLELDGSDRLQVETGVPESLASLSVDTALEVRAGHTSTEGKVEEIASSADPVSHTVPAKISLPAGAPFRPGQFVSVSIPAGTASPVVVPVDAVSRIGQIERVFVVEDSRANLRIIRTGATVGENIEVTAGLDACEIVITGGAAVRDGQRVEAAR